MSGSAPHRWTNLGCFWLLLVTVFAHAVIPAGSPLVRSQGSAFSMSTNDVSLAPKRRGNLADALQASESKSGFGALNGSDGADGQAAPISGAAFAPPNAETARTHRAAVSALPPAGLPSSNRARAPPTF